MDPNATWRMLGDCLRALHQNPEDADIRAHAVMLLEALTRWLRQGGFPPRVDSGAGSPDALNRNACNKYRP